MWIAIAAGTAIGLVLLIRKQQHRLLYFPNLNGMGESLLDPTYFNFRHKWSGVNMSVDGGDNLFGYFLMHGHDGTGHGAWRSAPTVIYFHGNAGNIGHRIPLAMQLHETARCNVLLVAYRGYKGSTDRTPSEHSFREDAQTAIRHISESGVDTNKVFLLGSSLGGAVTIAAAKETEVRLRGIALENTFTSISDMTDSIVVQITRVGTRRLQHHRENTNVAWHRYPIAAGLFVLHYLSTIWYILRPGLLSLQWHSEATIQTLPPHLPVLFLSGERDELVPPEHMKRLYRSSSSATKKFVGFPNGTHNDTCAEDRFFHEISAWIETCLRGPIGPGRRLGRATDETPKQS